MSSEEGLEQSPPDTNTEVKKKKKYVFYCPEGCIPIVKENVLLGNGTACYRMIAKEVCSILPTENMYLRVVEFTASLELKKGYLTLEEYVNKSKRLANGHKVFKKGDTVTIIYSAVYENYLKVCAERERLAQLQPLQNPQVQPTRVPMLCCYYPYSVLFQMPMIQPNMQLVRIPGHPDPMVMMTMRADCVNTQQMMLFQPLQSTQVENEVGEVSYDLIRENNEETSIYNENETKGKMGKNEEKENVEKGSNEGEKKVGKEEGVVVKDSKKMKNNGKKVYPKRSREYKDWSNVWIIVEAKKDRKVHMWQRNVELIGNFLKDGKEKLMPVIVLAAGYSYVRPRTFIKCGTDMRRCYQIGITPDTTLWVDEDLFVKKDEVTEPSHLEVSGDPLLDDFDSLNDMDGYSLNLSTHMEPLESLEPMETMETMDALEPMEPIEPPLQQDILTTPPLASPSTRPEPLQFQRRPVTIFHEFGKIKKMTKDVPDVTIDDAKCCGECSEYTDKEVDDGNHGKVLDEKEDYCGGNGFSYDWCI